MFHVKYTYHSAHPSTSALADRVAELRRGGETTFEDAKLRVVDERWWGDTLGDLEDAIRAEVRAQETSEADLIASIPSEAYELCKFQYSDKIDPVKVGKMEQEYIRKARHGHNWVLILGFMARDTERLLHEGLYMGDRVIRARSMLRAFFVAIAVELGCAKLMPENLEELDGA